jgi:hypothetical protein
MSVPVLDSSPNGPRFPRKPARVFLTVFAIVGALTTLWALASPLMAVPDEPAHTIRAAAVVRGEFGNVAAVPQYIATMQLEACFASKPKVAANCQNAVTVGGDELVRATSSASSNGPLFYAIVGLPSLVFDGSTAVYAMRIVSGLLSAGFIAATIAVLSLRLSSRWSILATVVATTPMVLFLGGSLNPNALEATSAVALFAGLITLFQGMAAPHYGLVGTIIVLSTLMLGGARSVALLWILLIVIGALLATPRKRLAELTKRTSVWIVFGLSVLVSMAAVAWFVWPRPATGDAAQPSFGNGRSAVLAELAEKTFEYWNAWVGYFGWLDRPAPTLVYYVWLTGIICLIVAGLTMGPVRLRLTTAYFAVLALVLPLAIQGALYGSFGIIWQGRYLLAVYGSLLVAAGVAIDAAYPGHPSRITARIVRVSIVAMGAAQIFAYVYTLRSYVVATMSWLQMLLRPLWQPPLGWLQLALLFTIVIAAAVAVLWRQPDWRPAADQPGTASDRP